MTELNYIMARPKPRASAALGVGAAPVRSNPRPERSPGAKQRQFGCFYDAAAIRCDLDRVVQDVVLRDRLRERPAAPSWY